MAVDIITIMTFFLCLSTAALSILIARRMRFKPVSGILFCIGLILMTLWLGVSIKEGSSDQLLTGKLMMEPDLLDIIGRVGFGAFALGLFLHTIGRSNISDDKNDK